MADDNKQEKFLQKAVKAHGDTYDYSNVVYINNKTKVEIICSKHGSFMQRPTDHISGGHGCPKCANEACSKAKLGVTLKPLSQKVEEFKEKARKVHGDYYKYKYQTFSDYLELMTIVCPKHGEFEQKPAYHVAGNGCPKCGALKAKKGITSTTEDFIEKASKVHHNKYKYSNTEYVHARKKVLITCPHHGDFLQRPSDHLSGYGCRECRTENIGWTDSKWETQGEQSRYFTGYKLYVAKIWDSEESFYKIGKTFVATSNRFKDINMYYNYKILHTIEADAKTVCELERKYQRLNRDNKYSPAIAFSGHTECFNKVTVEGVVYE